MITEAFKSRVAKYIDAGITKIVLNDGEHEITEFTFKEIDGENVTMNYLVPLGAVAAIAKIQLMDNDGNVVSENAVNVPISSDTLMIQNITVEEG